MLDNGSVVFQYLITITACVPKSGKYRLAITWITNRQAVIAANPPTCLVEKHANKLVGHIRFCASRCFGKATLNAKTHGVRFPILLCVLPKVGDNKIAASTSRAMAKAWSS